MTKDSDEGIVTALFRDPANVQRAYDATLARGYKQDDINLVMTEETRKRHFTQGKVDDDLAEKAAESTEKKTPDATELGGPIGGTAATLAPAVAAVSAAALLPGLMLAGPIAIALAAAGAVGIAGGLVGALVNWGLPKARVEEYESQIRNGGILIGVKPHNDEDALYLRNEWQAAGGI